MKKGRVSGLTARTGGSQRDNMASFFNISEKPDPKRYRQTKVADPVIRTEMASGDLVTRSRTTSIAKTRTIFYPSISEASKQTIEDWEKDTIGYGGKEFNWTDPNGNDVRTYGAVLLAPGIEFNLHPQNPNRWQASFARRPSPSSVSLP